MTREEQEEKVSVVTNRALMLSLPYLPPIGKATRRRGQ